MASLDGIFTNSSVAIDHLFDTIKSVFADVTGSVSGIFNS